MKYEEDMNSEFGEVFTKLENIILNFPNIKIRKNEHQTSYYDEYKTIVMLRQSSNKKYFVSSWGNGLKLQDKFNIFKGNGKIVRHIYFKSITDINEDVLIDVIKESMILNMEYYELKKLKLIKKEIK